MKKQRKQRRQAESNGDQSGDPYPSHRGQYRQTGRPRRAGPGLSRAVPTVRHALLSGRTTRQTACVPLSDTPFRTLASRGHHASGRHCPVLALQSGHCLSAVPERSGAVPDDTGGRDTRGTSQRATWREWNVPTLREPCIQANVNVVKLEESRVETYDYWLTISTLDKDQHDRRCPSNWRLTTKKCSRTQRPAREGNSIAVCNSISVMACGGSRSPMMRTFPVQTPPDAPIVGIDVGIANFVTTSTGKHYGTFHKNLRARHKRDRAKRRRKAKLRACLKKKGRQKLPSTSSRTGQRLIRHIKQEINRAVNQCFTDPEHSGRPVCL